LASTFGEISARLVRMMDAIHPLEPAVWTALLPQLVRRSFAPREHVSPLGSVQTKVGLLESGRVRAYFTTVDGKQYNKHFFTGPDFVGDYASLLTGRPVEVPQQTLTSCVVWFIERAAILGAPNGHLEQDGRLYVWNHLDVIGWTYLVAGERAALVP
jgi:CRP-like cAMP-binding protein